MPNTLCGVLSILFGTTSHARLYLEFPPLAGHGCYAARVSVL